MDGRLALYSGAVFAGVLVAGALVFKPGFGDGGNATNAEALGAAGAAATADSGQQGDPRSFASRLSSLFRGGGEDEHDGDRYEHHDDHEDDD